MSNLIGAAADCRARAPPGTSRETMVTFGVTTVPALAAPSHPRVLVVHFGPDLEINPVTKDWINHQLGVAEHDGYDAVVIELDTPGGLSTSMKQIYERELS